jgi:hypothetical protein
VSGYIVAVGANATLSIAPVTYAIRIGAIQAYYFSTTAAGNLSTYKYSPSTLSGGSAVTPIPLRDGAAAALATVKSGATPSGTQRQLSGLVVPPNGQASTKFVYDLIIQPGSVFHVTSTTASGDIQFEEFHLARST